MPGFQTPSQVTAPNPQGTFGVTPLGNFTLVANVMLEIDQLLAPYLRGVQGDVQSIWLDATLAVDPVVVRSQRTRQYTIYPAGSFGWQPLTLSMPDRLQVQSSAAAAISIQVATSVITPGIFAGSVINSSETSLRVDKNALTTDQLFLAANVQRQGASFFNESPAYLYLLEASGVSSPTNYSVRMDPFGYHETPYNYGGDIRGIWGAATGGVRITEFA